MILAAGKGKRMQDLTKSRPKPLLSVRGKMLIENQIEKLAEAGVKEIVINVAYLADQIIESIGFGKKWGVKICYSCEKEPLETGGGICQALPLLSDTFLSVNADIVTDYNYEELMKIKLSEKNQAHLILINNPAHNLKGDFSLIENKPSMNLNAKTYTYSGIALYHRSLFENYCPGKFGSVVEIWQKPLKEGLISASVHQGDWADIGTPERLTQINAHLMAK